MPPKDLSENNKSNEIQGKIRLIDWAEDHRMDESAARALANRSKIPIIRQGAVNFVDARLMDDAFIASFALMASKVEDRRKRAQAARQKVKADNQRLKQIEQYLVDNSNEINNLLIQIKDARDSNDPNKLLKSATASVDILTKFIDSLLAFAGPLVADSNANVNNDKKDKSSS